MKIYKKIIKVIRSIYYRRKFNRCGKDFEIGKLYYLKGPQSITIGNNVSISDGASINCKASKKSTLTIGNNVRI